MVRTTRALVLVTIALLAVAVPASAFDAVAPDAGAAPTAATSSDDTLSATVTDVVDGDTVDVRFSNGTTDTVRLLGVDTPEVYGANDPAEFEGVPNTEAGEQCLGKAGENASAYAKTA